MWSKFNSAFKMRSGTPVSVPEEGTEATGSGEVLASVFEQHPNLSVFHQSSEVPFPTPSPPASPSKHGRRGMFKRMSRSVVPNNDSVETLPRASISKKVKPSLHGLTTESLSRATAETFIRQSQDTARPSIDSTASRPSVSPATPVTEGKFGSLRSILKPGNTPGTGQSVRFFSRDAYRVISPEQSSSELEDPGLLSRLQRAAPARPSAQQLFATPPPPPPKDSEPSPPQEIVPSTSTPMMGQRLIPPPNLGNIFEFSQDVLNEVSSIEPIGARSPLLDTAVEVVETETETETEKEDPPKIDPKPADDSLPLPEVLGAPFEDMLSESKPPPGLHDRSQSFSFGQTIFQSVKTEDGPSKSVSARPPSANRSRALSDTVFTTMIHSATSALKDNKRPEADINDTSKAVVAYQPAPKVVEHDPFGANAMTYYEPGKMLPPSPPQSNHTRTASREEDIIWSLRTQLALQSWRR
ncbi:hypothetical protein NM688_g4284 [Phlebia brevispora]|uniref:Uncharacterized protein n=1 Tax=Phlebia brevispora TaxID=194682 RepID=A0ACC1T3L1_9APHY|nr:hypothetical protein NM688_g4284 [Phlebia brevispora]